MHDAFKTYARRHLQQQITDAIRSKHATRVHYALGRDDARSQDGVAERRFPKAVTDFVVILSRHWYSKPSHGGVSFCVVCAMGSILWPSRDRVAGISSRRGASLSDHILPVVSIELFEADRSASVARSQLLNPKTHSAHLQTSPAPVRRPPGPACGEAGGANLRKQYCRTRGLRVLTATIAQSPLSDFRKALRYNVYYC